LGPRPWLWRSALWSAGESRVSGPSSQAFNHAG